MEGDEMKPEIAELIDHQYQRELWLNEPDMEDVDFRDWWIKKLIDALKEAYKPVDDAETAAFVQVIRADFGMKYRDQEWCDQIAELIENLARDFETVSKDYIASVSLRGKLEAEIERSYFTEGYVNGLLSEIDGLKTERDQLQAAAEATIEDLRLRGEDGVVNLSHSVWIQLCDAVATKPEKCEHGKGIDDYCEPCGRIHGG